MKTSLVKVASSGRIGKVESHYREGLGSGQGILVYSVDWAFTGQCLLIIQPGQDTLLWGGGGEVS